jgi:hypothetical protein
MNDDPIIRYFSRYEKTQLFEIKKNDCFCKKKGPLAGPLWRKKLLVLFNLTGLELGGVLNQSFFHFWKKHVTRHHVRKSEEPIHRV